MCSGRIQHRLQVKISITLERRIKGLVLVSTQSRLERRTGRFLGRRWAGRFRTGHRHLLRTYDKILSTNTPWAPAYVHRARTPNEPAPRAEWPGTGLRQRALLWCRSK